MSTKVNEITSNRGYNPPMADPPPRIPAESELTFPAITGAADIVRGRLVPLQIYSAKKAKFIEWILDNIDELNDESVRRIQLDAEFWLDQQDS